MPLLDTLLLKTASRCNLDCTYCYVYQGADQSWKEQPYNMSDEVISTVIHRIIQFSHKQDTGFAIVLHGGEPLLLGYPKLKKLLSGLRSGLNESKYPISIQTNGALLNKKILDICAFYKVSISVSLDGSRKANDIARFTRGGKSSHDSVMAGINLLQTHPESDFLFAGTLSVVQTSVPAHETYNFLKSVATPSIDFLFQDGNHSRMPFGKKSFQSTEYGEWLSDIFNLYINDPDPVPIKILDDLIKLTLGGSTSKEGKGEHEFGILVIESDGEIRKNDTLRASFEGVDYFIGRPTIFKNSIESIINTDEFLDYVKNPKIIAKECSNCQISHICGGGMPLYRWSETNGFNNPSVYCSDHKFIINNIIDFVKEYEKERAFNG